MKKYLKHLIVALTVVSIFVLGGCASQEAAREGNQPQSETSEQARIITYAGQEGRSVCDILKESYMVEADESSFGLMVKSIDTLAATSSEFWLYSVNGEQPDVACDKYTTKDTDEITWEYKGM